MKVTLTLIALALGFAVSLWLATRLTREISGETTDQRMSRHDRWMRNMAAALGCGFTAMFVGVVWLQDAADDAERATDIALAASRRNCLNEQADQEATVVGLIADVRLARATYQASVDALLQADEQAQEVLPDPSMLPESVQAYIAALVEASVVRSQHERERFLASVERWSDELATREAALDEARTRTITSCPPADIDAADEPTETT